MMTSYPLRLAAAALAVNVNLPVSKVAFLVESSFLAKARLEFSLDKTDFDKLVPDLVESSLTNFRKTTFEHESINARIDSHDDLAHNIAAILQKCESFVDTNPSLELSGLSTRNKARLFLGGVQVINHCAAVEAVDVSDEETENDEPNNDEDTESRDEARYWISTWLYRLRNTEKGAADTRYFRNFLKSIDRAIMKSHLFGKVRKGTCVVDGTSITMQEIDKAVYEAHLKYYTELGEFQPAYWDSIMESLSFEDSPCPSCGGFYGAHSVECPYYIPMFQSESLGDVSVNQELSNNSCPACGRPNGINSVNCPYHIQIFKHETDSSDSPNSPKSSEEISVHQLREGTDPSCGGSNCIHAADCPLYTPTLDEGTGSFEEVSMHMHQWPDGDLCPSCGGANGLHLVGCPFYIPMLGFDSLQGDIMNAQQLMSVCVSCGGSFGWHQLSCPSYHPL